MGFWAVDAGGGGESAGGMRSDVLSGPVALRNGRVGEVGRSSARAGDAPKGAGRQDDGIGDAVLSATWRMGRLQTRTDFGCQRVLHFNDLSECSLVTHINDISING